MDDEREPSADERAGMEWWNSLPERERALWLGKAQSAKPVDAWAAYKRVMTEAKPIAKFDVNGHSFLAEACVAGILVNPVLPETFNDTPNDERPHSQAKWWNLPYVVTESVERLDAMYASRTDEYAEAGRKHWAESRAKWMEAWPGGTRYETRCLDGGAWDRSTSWGMFATLEEALACAHAGPQWKELRDRSCGEA
jgi:hypothetical protein